ncbi:hypothetical protein ACFFRR_006860 [Megaselia abdita]
MKFFLVSACVLLLASGLNAQLSDCLEKDSISCLQLSVFRQAKSFFDNPNIEIFGGVSLLKENDGRQGKSIEDNSIAVETAPTFEARNGEMGTYFLDSAKNFFTERSLNFNFANTARSIASAIPEDIKADVSELIAEGRTLKKKKALKKLLPLIKGIGAKVGLLAVGAIVGLTFLVKKALVVSVLAFGLALIVGIANGAGAAGGILGRLGGGLGGLFGGKNSGSSSGWSSGSNAGWSSGSNAGWSSGGSNNGWSSSGSGWDTHGAYSSPVAQAVAYSGYPQAQQQ